MEKQVTPCPCSDCKKYIASKNCHACSRALCVSCVRVAVVKFSDSASYKTNSDFELLERCAKCDGAKTLPTVVSGNYDCVVQ